MLDFDNIILFNTYICVADGFIHDKETLFLHELINNNNVSDNLQSEVDAIIGDLDSKKTLNTVLEELSDSDENTQKQALSLGINIAYVDGYLDPSEQKIIDQFLEITGFPEEEYLKYKEEVQMKSEYNDIVFNESLLDKGLKAGLKVLRSVTTGEVKVKIEKSYNKFLLNGKEYADAIKVTRNIGKVDLKLVSKKITEINESLTSALKKIDNEVANSKKLENSKEEVESELFDILFNLSNGLKNTILKGLEANKNIIEKKNRSLDYYTISFLGKTKAGKSTLHSIITGDGKEHIGKGKQRTTRYNRVYEWNYIRIIDTPGIGAPGGQKDELIAEQVIEESDLICYIVKADSIQESEFKFLKKIKDYNKPIVILLNYKENLQNEVMLRRFLQNPEKWYKQSGEKAILGHINRIESYASKHYKNGYFNIFPVQLLAASMSMEDNYQQYSKILYNSSRIQDFLDSLRLQIIEEGRIKKTQNMTDGSIHTLITSNNKLKELRDPLIELEKKISSNKSSILTKIEKSYKENSKDLKSQLINIFTDLKENKAMDFASQNYDAKKNIVSSRWESYLKENRVNENIQDSVTKVVESYINDVKESIKEVEENISFFSKLELKGLKLEISDIINFKSITKIISGVLGVIGAVLLLLSNPVGWVFAGIGIIGGFLSVLFKSKANKIREATDKLYISIKEGIEKNEAGTINKIQDGFKQNHNNVKKEIDVMFTNLSNIIRTNINFITPEIEKLEQAITDLNKFYALRVINYINGSSDENLSTDDLEKVVVNRSFGEKIEIKTTIDVLEKKIEKVEKIIQEDIEIEKEGK